MYRIVESFPRVYIAKAWKERNQNFAMWQEMFALEFHKSISTYLSLDLTVYTHLNDADKYTDVETETGIAHAVYRL